MVTLLQGARHPLYKASEFDGISLHIGDTPWWKDT